jgi:hypothetical protein
MFINFNKKLVNIDTIDCITTDDLTSHGFIHVHFKDGQMECVEGVKAVEVVMRLCPAALEGRQMKYIRHRWAVHNLIGHPLMQVLSWLGLPKLGIRVHDVTAPYPKMNHVKS